MAAEEGRLSDTLIAARHFVNRAPCLQVVCDNMLAGSKYKAPYTFTFHEHRLDIGCKQWK